MGIRIVVGTAASQHINVHYFAATLELARARMPPSFAALGADHVDANVEAFTDMLGVSDHIHVEDTGLVKTLNDMDGGNTDG